MAVFVLGLMSRIGHCNTPPVKIQLTTDKPDIFVGDFPSINIKITNTGTTDLKVINSDYPGFKKQWVVDNPRIVIAEPCYVGDTWQPMGEHNLKPGESYEEAPRLYIPENIPKIIRSTVISEDLTVPAPITIRFGFIVTPNTQPIWSNPVTINFKKNESLPVRIEATLDRDTMDISDVQRPQPLEASLKITNISNAPVDIGTAGLCGLHELKFLKSDNEAIVIDSGITACLTSLGGEYSVVLKPQETWEQKCRIMYQGEDSKPAPVTFRIGVQNMGHLPVWSNPLTLNIIGGTPQWTKHMVYLKDMMKPVSPSQNGVVKKYYETGELYEEQTYVEGKLNGPYKRYSKNGHIQEELNYKDGQIEHERRYYEDGKLQTDISYHNGFRGEYTVYKEDGSVQERSSF